MKTFEEYVKDFADSKEISVDEAKTHAIVKGAKEYYDSYFEFEDKVKKEEQDKLSQIGG